MRVKELFEFVTDPTINKDNLDEYLQLAQEKAVASTITTAEEEVSEAVSMSLYQEFLLRLLILREITIMYKKVYNKI